jgi:DNA-binding NtrC family response regulator
VAFLPKSSPGAVETALGVPVTWCDTVSGLLAALAPGGWSVALVSLDHEAVDEALLARLAATEARGALFAFAGTRSVEGVIGVERAGAVSLLADPPIDAELRREVRPIVEERADVPLPEGERAGNEDPTGIGVIGSSRELMEVFRVAARVASTPVTVLITGESGTGKELVARALHDQGARRTGPFVAVNCAAIPDTLLEAELFGYEKGAFTGAVVASDGRFGRAHGGTLFLDEIGELSLPLQAKLLRVLETGEVERLGGGRPATVDVRVVAATNQPLRERAETGRFREDLLFRLAIVEVELPPLRRRGEDVLPLAFHFASHFSRRYDRPVHALSAAARDKLATYPWPGNVRELRNVMDRAVLLARGGVIRSTDVRIGADAPRTSPVDEGTGGVGYAPTMSLREVEAAHVRRVLEHTKGHMGEAAAILGVHRNTMTMKVREHGLDVRPAAEGA